MKASEAIELEGVRDAFRTHFRTDPDRRMRRDGAQVIVEVDITHVVGLTDCNKRTPFGNGARFVYNLDFFLKAAAVVRDAYPDQDLVVAFSDDAHWPCVVRPLEGQYGVAIAPRQPDDEFGDGGQSGIATIAPSDLNLKPGEEEF